MLEVAVRKHLDGFRLDADFAAGAEITVLLGPSGSGKTLTLRAIAGVLTPDSGRIALNGRMLFDSASSIDIPPQSRRIGYVPQSYALFPHLDVEANVSFGLGFKLSEEDRARTAKLIEMTGLSGLEHRRPRQLSGGQQQRVAIARALAVQPDLLLLDEPFAALDRSLREPLREDLRRLQQEVGFRILLVTHDEDDLRIAQQVIHYEDGRVVA